MRNHKKSSRPTKLKYLNSSISKAHAKKLKKYSQTPNRSDLQKFDFGGFLNKVGTGAADAMLGYTDYMFGMFGMPNQIQDSAYSDTGFGNFANKSGSKVGEISKTAMPMAMNIVAPGSGQVIKGVQNEAGKFNPEAEKTEEELEAERLDQIKKSEEAIKKSKLNINHTINPYGNFKKGGKLKNKKLLKYQEGGTFEQISDDTLKVNGKTHEQGGENFQNIAEVEDDETINLDKNRVVSDSIDIKGKPIKKGSKEKSLADYDANLARQISKIEKKLKDNPGDKVAKTTIEKLQQDRNRLYKIQEQAKQSNPNLQQAVAKFGGSLGEYLKQGGKLPKYITGGKPFKVSGNYTLPENVTSENWYGYLNTIPGEELPKYGQDNWWDSEHQSAYDKYGKGYQDWLGNMGNSSYNPDNSSFSPYKSSSSSNSTVSGGDPNTFNASGFPALNSGFSYDPNTNSGSSSASGLGNMSGIENAFGKKDDKSSKFPLSSGDTMQLLGMLPSLIYNTVQATRPLEKVTPDIATPNYNPYEYQTKTMMANRKFDEQPAVNEVYLNRNAASSDIDNSTRGDAVRRANRLQLYSNTDSALAKIRMEGQAVNQGYRGEEATTLNNLGQQRVGAKNLAESITRGNKEQAQAINSMNKATRQQFAKAAVENLGQGLTQFGQAKNQQGTNTVQMSVLQEIARNYKIDVNELIRNMNGQYDSKTGLVQFQSKGK